MHFDDLHTCSDFLPLRIGQKLIGPKLQAALKLEKARSYLPTGGRAGVLSPINIFWWNVEYTVNFKSMLSLAGALGG